MKVIFLDFDGVLNSGASVLLSIRRRIANPLDDSPTNEDLCDLSTSNFQMVLDFVPDAQIVISSSWRNMFSMEELKAKLTAYGIDASRVIDKTPSLSTFSSRPRGHEITEWLHGRKDIESYAIVDDLDDMTDHMDYLVQTDYDVGLTLQNALSVIKLLDNDFDKKQNIFKRYYKEQTVVHQRAMSALSDEDDVAGEAK